MNTNNWLKNHGIIVRFLILFLFGTSTQKFRREHFLYLSEAKECCPYHPWTDIQKRFSTIQADTFEEEEREGISGASSSMTGWQESWSSIPQAEQRGSHEIAGMKEVQQHILYICCLSKIALWLIFNVEFSAGGLSYMLSITLGWISHH